MKFREYGTEQKDTILLLHGGGLSWWNYREAAELLQEDYHVILPVLDGHAGSDRPFTTIEENAAEIIEFIDERLNGSVLLIGGLSLGGQILLEMLSQRADICAYALVESAAVLPSKLTNALVAPA
ncbi:MAG: alpha/beta fold hydrolase, partial [Lachnospiraceae bacterium]|nr:alpha/beta fold hydrolase [Lachnospiraceae bacterium]